MSRIKNEDVWVKLSDVQRELEDINKLKYELRSIKDLENRLREAMTGTHLIQILSDLKTVMLQANMMMTSLKDQIEQIKKICPINQG